MKKYMAIIFILSLLGCQEKQTEKENWWLWTASWSPNSQQIITGGTQNVLRLFSSTTNELEKNYSFEGTITKAKWHPFKNQLGISIQGEQSRSSIFNLDTNERILLDSINDFGARAIGWNHTGELLAVGDYDGFIIIFDDTGKFLKKVNVKQKGLMGLDWHPTKNLIVAVGEKIALYDFENDALNRIEDRSEDVLMLCVEWHPAGDLFVTGDYGDFNENYPPLLQFWTLEGKKIKFIEESEAEYRNLKWSKNGELLATASEKIRLWSKEGNLIAEKESENLLWGIDWNQEGNKIVTTDGKGTIIIWDKDLNTKDKLHY